MIVSAALKVVCPGAIAAHCAGGDRTCQRRAACRTAASSAQSRRSCACVDPFTRAGVDDRKTGRRCERRHVGSRARWWRLHDFLLCVRKRAPRIAEPYETIWLAKSFDHKSRRKPVRMTAQTYCQFPERESPCCGRCLCSTMLEPDQSVPGTCRDKSQEGLMPSILTNGVK